MSQRRGPEQSRNDTEPQNPRSLGIPEDWIQLITTMSFLLNKEALSREEKRRLPKLLELLKHRYYSNSDRGEMLLYDLIYDLIQNFEQAINAK